MWNGPASPRTIKYDHPQGDLSGWTALGGYIDYTDSAGEKKNDGDKLHVALMDEEGKCLSPQTEVLMADGSRKQAQHIVAGDVLMGDNADHRTVLATTSGESEMYRVIPKKGDPWECNKNHILTVRVSDACTINGVKRPLHSVMDIDLQTYLSLSERCKRSLCLIRSGVEYKAKNHTIGFTVESIGRGPYNGFTVDGNGRFLLGDYTVTHNCENGISVFERWNVNKLAMSLGGGSDIVGWSMHPSTVEEMNEGGMEYLMLASQSKFYERAPNGQTLSGLFEMFIPAQNCLEGFIDKWGFSVVDDPTEEQIKHRPKAVFAQLGHGARKYLQDKLDVLLKKGDPASLEQYRSERRKMPMCYADCWLGTSGDIGFNMEIIDARLAENRRESPMVKGFFRWKGGVVDSEVEWVSDPRGKFELSRHLKRHETNQRIRQEAFDYVRDDYTNEWAPKRGYQYTLGMDPFRYTNKSDARMSNSSSRQSDGGIAVLWERDEKLDPGDDPTMWESRRFVLSYRHRPRSQAEYFEDCLMAAVYFGAMVYMERNIERGWEYFIDRSYGGYLMYEIDRATGKKKDKPGFTSLTQSKASLFSEIKDYIEYRGHRECHSSFLRECKDIKGQEEMTRYDRFTAHGACLLGSQQNYHNRLLEGEGNQNRDVNIREIANIIKGWR
jgi:hypothetical protein